jgi:hypothetical protein
MLNSFIASLVFSVLFLASVSALLFLLARLEPPVAQPWASRSPSPSPRAVPRTFSGEPEPGAEGLAVRRAAP